MATEKTTAILEEIKALTILELADLVKALEEEFGGLLGHAPIMPLSGFSCESFIGRGGRIPAPIHSLRN